jgi:hypothetical protein
MRSCSCFKMTEKYDFRIWNASQNLYQNLYHQFPK